MKQKHQSIGKKTQESKKPPNLRDVLKKLFSSVIGEEAAEALMEAGFETENFQPPSKGQGMTQVLRFNGPVEIGGLQGAPQGIIMDDRNAMVGSNTVMNINGQCLSPGMYEKSDAGEWERLEGQPANEQQSRLKDGHEKMLAGQGRGARHKFPEDRGIGFCHLTQQGGQMTATGPDGRTRVARKDTFQVPTATKNPGLTPRPFNSGPRTALAFRSRAGRNATASL